MTGFAGITADLGSRNDAIVMQSKTCSSASIRSRVDYVFQERERRRRAGTVAFPMPLVSIGTFVSVA